MYYKYILAVFPCNQFSLASSDSIAEQLLTYFTVCEQKVKIHLSPKSVYEAASSKQIE